MVPLATDSYSISIPQGWWVDLLRWIGIILCSGILIALPTVRMNRRERRKARKLYNAGIAVVALAGLVGNVTRLGEAFNPAIPEALIGYGILFLALIRDTRSAKKESNGRKDS